MRKRAAGGLFLTIVLTATPALAHSTEELDEWVAEWTTEADHSLSPTLIDEFQDMAARHPGYFHHPIYVEPSFSASYSGNVEQWRTLVSGYDWNVDTALCVIRGESGGDPLIDNRQGSSAAGLWQFLKGTWDWVADQTGGPSYDSGAPYDPVIATGYAYWLWARQGWGPWNAARNC